MLLYPKNKLIFTSVMNLTYNLPNTYIMQKISLQLINISTFFITLFCCLSIKAQNDFITNEIIIKFANNAPYTFDAEDTGCSLVQNINCINAELWCVPDTLIFGGDTIIGEENISNYFENLDGIVEYAHPNWLAEISVFPNDPFFNQLWGMNKIKAPEAWETQTGNAVIVGVNDSGVDWTHPDLRNNIWENLGEDLDGDGTVLQWNGNTWVFDPGDVNGVDDDGNGYADDFVGWDFYNDDNNPMDNEGHGTHVAGTIGAVGNNSIGISGVCWNAQIMPLKTFENNTGSTSAIIDALEYSIIMGAPLSNNSWGFSPNLNPPQALQDAITVAEQNNHLFVAAAGNNGNDIEVASSFPASYPNQNILSVTATNILDKLPAFANYGLNSVDLAAPGVGIYSTGPNNSYYDSNGTSMAAPHATGAAALLLSECNTLSYQDLKNILITTVDVKADLNGKCISSGRLNVEDALNTASIICNATSCLTFDSLTLVKVYNQMDGPNWTNTWDLSQPVNTWYGVGLSSDGCKITHLNLNNNQVSGSMSSDLANLYELTSLNLNSNQLSGAIPNELGNLSNLRYLYLSDNQLSGAIPNELGNLSNLRYLYLSDNQLIGNIPTTLGNLYSLSILSLNNNQLTGCYPQSLCTLNLALHDFENNTQLPLDGSNQFFEDFCDGLLTCTVSCSSYDSLALVAVYNATNGPNWLNTWDLSQPINTWYGVTMTSDGCAVKELQLQGNNLSGTLPPELGNFSELTYLELSSNQLNGPIPTTIGNLSNLETLIIYNSQLTGSIPSNFGNLTNLSNLNISYNSLSGNIPTSLGNLNNLTYLHLNNNQLTGNIPTQLGNLSNIYYLTLANNQLSGSIPTELGNLASTLNILILFNNQLSGNIPPELGNLNNLIELYLNGNQLSGSIPSELGNLSSLSNLYLQNNQLSGSIPSELGNISGMYNLYLNDNQLSGSIPPELGNFTSLNRLYAYNNQLSGCYPSALCNTSGNYSFASNPGLPSNGSSQGFQAFCNGAVSCVLPCSYSDSLALVALYKETNGANWNSIWDLTQPISTWSGVTLSPNGCNVTAIDLPNNQLIGTLPNELANLSALYQIDLSNNQLTGSIPTEVGNLSNLNYLDLSNNQLTGSIPTELGNISGLQYLLLNNNQLTGSIPVELGFLSMLLEVHLNDNQLSATLPVELSYGNISVLYLHNNQLSGCYPQDYCNAFSNFTFDNNSGLPNNGAYQGFLDFCNGSTSCTNTCLTPDSLVLVALYNATDGPNWATSWDLTQPVYTWSNVTLSSDGCNVIDLFLPNNQLSGTIPPEIGELSELINFIASDNQLYGTIPPEIGNLSNNLQWLHLDNNELWGNIPPELGNLSNLNFLQLNGNYFGGSIPAELGMLSNLYELNLSENDLIGEIPAELGYLPNLTILYLQFNQLSGCYPQSLCNLNLNNFDFNDNYSLPDSGLFSTFLEFCGGMGACSNSCLASDSIALVDFYYAANGSTWLNTWDLSTPVETWHGVNTDGCNVISLNLVSNQLSGYLHASLGSLSNLQYLYLTNNQLTGNIPSTVGNLSNVLNINLSNNQLIGAIPSTLGSLLNLNYLYLDDNQLSGSIPSNLGNITSLFHLNLASNQLTGTIPSNLGNLSNITHLALENNQLTGNIPPILGNLSSLSFLSLAHNQLTGNIPPSLGNLSNLIFLDLFNNQLSGCYPSALCNLNILYYNFNNNPQLPEGGSTQSFPDFCNGLIICGSNYCNANSLNLGSDLNINCSESLTLSTNTNNMLYTLWDYEGTPIGTTPSINISSPGLYIAIVQDSCGNISTDSIQVVENFNCVWPGDADNNNIVNVIDYLYVGLDHGKNGFSRFNATTNWIGQTCSNWFFNGPNGVNDKHSDCTGNGQINDGDLAIVELNYGEVHGAITPPNAQPINNSLSTSNNTSASSFATGTFAIDIFLDQNTTDLNGMTFTIDYNVSGALDEVEFILDESWFGDEGVNTAAMAHCLPNQNKIDIAITRTDGFSAAGSGKIGRLDFKENDVVPWDSLINITLTVNNSFIMDTNGNLHALNNSSNTLSLSSLPDCPPQIVHDAYEFVNGTYKAEDNIESASLINNPSMATYKAGNYIELNSGFQVSTGSSLSIDIEDCTTLPKPPPNTQSIRKE